MLAGRTALITGANSGIGYQTALALALRKCKVIMADCVDQTESKNNIIEETCNENIVTQHLNLASFNSVRCFVKELVEKENSIDILINNAGVFCMKGRKSCDGLDAVLQINHFGPFLLTNLLSESLKKSTNGRIIFITSSGAFFHNLNMKNLKEPDNCPPGILGTTLNYYNSKLCNMIASKGFAHKLRDYGITSNCLHPGMTNTDFLAKIHADDDCFEKFSKKVVQNILKCINKDVSDAAQLTTFLATCKSLKCVSGKYFVDYKIHRQPRILECEKFCSEIWKESEKIVAV